MTTSKQESKTTTDAKRQFMMDEIWMLSVAGAFQRAGIYKNKSFSESKREEFRAEVRGIVDKWVCYLLQAKDDSEYIDKLERIRDAINEIGKKYSGDVSEFHLGKVQKLVNLYLKYQWCIGLIDNTHVLHCPFDRTILESLGINDAWTQSAGSECENRKRYKGWVEAARKKAGDGKQSIAEWEVKVFNQNR